jgi:hypothetical protein
MKEKMGMEPTRENLERMARAFTEALTEAFGEKKVGFGVILLDFKEGGYLGWCSNAEREGMVNAMKEFIDKNGGMSIERH